MERRKSLAAAATVSLVVMSGVAAWASTTGVHVLGFGAPDAVASPAATTLASSDSTDPTSTDASTTASTVDTVAGPTTTAAPVYVTQIQIVKDVIRVVRKAADPVVVDTTAPTTTLPASSSASTAPAPATTAAPVTTATTIAPTTTTKAPTTTTKAPTPTTRPRTTTTVAGAPTTLAGGTTTTRPPGVPADWPANKPIPPMPPGCVNGQLELNGVWNCQ